MSDYEKQKATGEVAQVEEEEDIYATVAEDNVSILFSCQRKIWMHRFSITFHVVLSF